MRPTRASTRVTVDRGTPSAALICQAVARVRRSATIAASGASPVAAVADAAVTIHPRARLTGARDPFRHRAHAEPNARRNLAMRPALLAHARQSAAASGMSSSRYDELSFGSASRNAGLVWYPHCFQRLPNEQRI